MPNIVVAHGAWSSGWAWKKMRTLLRAAGHEVFTPSYSGLGERQHLAAPEISLSTHVQDVVGVLEFEDLRDVVLVGHSFGGMVASGVADRARERIRQVIYIDAFVPESGTCLFDLVPAAWRDRMRQAAREGDGWRVPANPMPPDTPDADRVWAEPRRRPHPVKAFEEPLHVDEAAMPPRAYIYCTRCGPDDVFAPFAARAKRDGWPYADIDASHNPHITAPEELGALLASLMRA
jgi:pimeloyl-ACP methyl ester carboxylesterase